MGEKLDFKTLVLAGGCVKGISTLGALQYVCERQETLTFENFIGTSSGAIICFLLCIGYTPIEIFCHIIQEKLMENIMKTLTLTSIFENKGVLSYTPIQTFLEKLTLAKIGYFPTLKDISAKHGKNLVICTYDMTKETPVYLSGKTFPDLPCITALRMTSNIPFIFDKFKYMGSYYVDGGIVDNFPIIYTVENTEEDFGRVLGFYPSSPSTEKKEDNSPLSYFVDLIYTLPNIIRKEHVKKSLEILDKSSVIIPVKDDVFVLGLHIPVSVKLNIFSSGYSQSKDYFDLKEKIVF